MNVRVRFAPSPTGYLHIGGARTALFNWLFARHHGGVFILRIEDTDAARNTDEAVRVILEGLQWLGLDWDEGPHPGGSSAGVKGDRGPYFQSLRAGVYRQHLDVLLKANRAYEQDGAIKFRMTRDPILIPDLVAGPVNRPLTDREELNPDFVLMRADGSPVFHFVNVVDDLEMGITHVIRGEDHLSNTAKHIALFQALDAPVPQYAHIPLILNPDGSKMSKRDTGSSLSAYIEGGYAPESVVNYLCLLGWSPKMDREILSLEELIRLFDLDGIQRHNAKFDAVKLNWMNAEYIRQMNPSRFNDLAIAALRRAGVQIERFPAPYLEAALATCKGKVKLFTDLPAYAGFYFTDTIEADPESARATFTPESLGLVRLLSKSLSTLTPFDAPSIESSFKAIAAQAGVKVSALVHPVRLACTGQKAGPSLYHLIEVLGRERTLKRLELDSVVTGIAEN